MLRSGNASDGQYAVELRNLTPSAPGEIWQEVATTIGVRQTLRLAWQAPLGQDNLVPNGFFLDPTMAPWTGELRGSPVPTLAYIPAPADADHGNINVYVNPLAQQGFTTLATPLRSVSFDAWLRVPVTLIPGIPHSIDVRLTAWVFRRRPTPIVGLASGETLPRVGDVQRRTPLSQGMASRAAVSRCVSPSCQADGSPALTWTLHDPTGARIVGPLRAPDSADTTNLCPNHDHLYAGRADARLYLGNPGPLVLSSAVITQSTLPIMGQPFLRLGTPAQPIQFSMKGCPPARPGRPASIASFHRRPRRA